MRKNLTRAVLAALALFMVAPAYADGPGDGGPERSRAAGARAALPTTQPPPTVRQQPAAAPQGRTRHHPARQWRAHAQCAASYRFYRRDRSLRASCTRQSTQAPAGTVLRLACARKAGHPRAGTWATVDELRRRSATCSRDGLRPRYAELRNASARSAPNAEPPLRRLRDSPAFNAEAARTSCGPSALRRRAARARQGFPLRAESARPQRRCRHDLDRQRRSACRRFAAAPGELRGMLNRSRRQAPRRFPSRVDTVSSLLGARFGDGRADAAARNWRSRLIDGHEPDRLWRAWRAISRGSRLASIVLAIGGYLLMRRREDDDLEEYEELKRRGPRHRALQWRRASSASPLLHGPPAHSPSSRHKTRAVRGAHQIAPLLHDHAPAWPLQRVAGVWTFDCGRPRSCAPLARDDERRTAHRDARNYNDRAGVRQRIELRQEEATREASHAFRFERARQESA
jgi:hypothetical protein